MEAGEFCSSGLPHDSDTAACASWCSAQEAYHHCGFCKCRACLMCIPPEEKTHVYANAGPSSVACRPGTDVAYPQDAAGSDSDASLEDCKIACDTVDACMSFFYSTSQRKCSLKAEKGEPDRFCTKPEWTTYWR
eukprot:76581-Pleurochrysis_carterae.AAC.1